MSKIVVVYFITLFLIIGCGPQHAVYQKTSYFDFVDKNMTKQTKGDITVELLILDSNEYKKSYYTQNIEVIDLPLFSSTPEIVEIPFTISYYDGLTAFKVNIINDTDHILRMRDSRIAFIDPDSDEPIMALTKTEILDDVESYFPYFSKLKNYILNKYFKTPPSAAEKGVTKAFKKVTKKIKFINGFNKEILPGMKSSGVLLFPITPEQASQGKISFIDLVSKTDNAGNAIEKVRMDYLVEVMYNYWRYEPKLKKWENINQKEYEERGTAVKRKQENKKTTYNNASEDENDEN